MRQPANRRPPHGTSVSCRALRAATPPAILAAARDGELGALLVGGVELADLPDPDAALAAIDAAPFVLSLELRESAVTERADVVFPVAPVVEKGGAFVNWEGRIRPFEPALQTNATPDRRVLHFLADELGVDLNLPNGVGRRARRWRAWGCGQVSGRAHRTVAPLCARQAGQGTGRAGRLAHAARRWDACRTANRTSRAPPGSRSVRMSSCHRRRNRCRRR